MSFTQLNTENPFVNKNTVKVLLFVFALFGALALLSVHLTETPNRVLPTSILVVWLSACAYGLIIPRVGFQILRAILILAVPAFISLVYVNGLEPVAVAPLMATLPLAFMREKEGTLLSIAYALSPLVFLVAHAADDYGVWLRLQVASVITPLLFWLILRRYKEAIAMVDYERQSANETNNVLRETLSELAVAKAKLETLSFTDDLTGLYNRRKLDEVLKHEIARGQRFGTSLAVIMLDIDHFKDVNDSYGHLAGDKLLKELSNILSVHIRETDTLGRWGGEEFFIVSPGEDICGVEILAEKLRGAVAEHSDPEIGTSTCSFGVAVWQANESANDVVGRVDAALYKAKISGRNRVEVADN